MRVKFVDDMYEVVSHVIEHNYELTREKWNHLHRYERSIPSDKMIMIEGSLLG